MQDRRSRRSVAIRGVRQRGRGRIPRTTTTTTTTRTRGKAFFSSREIWIDRRNFSEVETRKGGRRHRRSRGEGRRCHRPFRMRRTSGPGEVAGSRGGETAGGGSRNSRVITWSYSSRIPPRPSVRGRTSTANAANPPDRDSPRLILSRKCPIPRRHTPNRPRNSHDMAIRVR